MIVLQSMIVATLRLEGKPQHQALANSVPWKVPSCVDRFACNLQKPKPQQFMALDINPAS